MNRPFACVVNAPAEAMLTERSEDMRDPAKAGFKARSRADMMQAAPPSIPARPNTTEWL